MRGRERDRVGVVGRQPGAVVLADEERREPVADLAGVDVEDTAREQEVAERLVIEPQPVLGGGAAEVLLDGTQRPIELGTPELERPGQLGGSQPVAARHRQRPEQELIGLTQTVPFGELALQELAVVAGEPGRELERAGVLEPLRVRDQVVEDVVCVEEVRPAVGRDPLGQRRARLGGQVGRAEPAGGVVAHVMVVRGRVGDEVDRRVRHPVGRARVRPAREQQPHLRRQLAGIVGRGAQDVHQALPAPVGHRLVERVDQQHHRLVGLGAERLQRPAQEAVEHLARRQAGGVQRADPHAAQLGPRGRRLRRRGAGEGDVHAGLLLDRGERLGEPRVARGELLREACEDAVRVERRIDPRPAEVRGRQPAGTQPRPPARRLRPRRELDETDGERGLARPGVADDQQPPGVARQRADRPPRRPTPPRELTRGVGQRGRNAEHQPIIDDRRHSRQRAVSRSSP